MERDIETEFYKLSQTMIDGFSITRKYSSHRILQSITYLLTDRTESRDAIASKNPVLVFVRRKIYIKLLNFAL